MRRASILVIVLFIGLSLECNAQRLQAGSAPNPPTKDSQSSPLPARVGHYRPKISLQDALKIAEDYIRKEQIDIRPYWLYRAIYILVGDEKTPDEKKLPAWHFWWVSETGTSGDDVEILVYMDGKAYRAPSM